MTESETVKRLLEHLRGRADMGAGSYLSAREVKMLLEHIAVVGFPKEDRPIDAAGRYLR